MANEKNLRPGNPATRFHAGEGNGRGAVENGRKSGEARRKKADLRKMAQAVIDGTYKDKNGNEVTGEEMLIRGLVANMADPKGKNWGKTIDLLIMLTGAQRTDAQRKREKVELEFLKAKVELLKGGDDVSLSKLDSILGNLERTALDGGDSTTKPETE